MDDTFLWLLMFMTWFYFFDGYMMMIRIYDMTNVHVYVIDMKCVTNYLWCKMWSIVFMIMTYMRWDVLCLWLWCIRDVILTICDEGCDGYEYVMDMIVIYYDILWILDAMKMDVYEM